MNNRPFSIEDKFAATLGENNMITVGDNVMVCVSGGADSMALLSLFARLRGKIGINSLSACHFNHGLRGAESDADEVLVRAFCEKHNIPLICENGCMNDIKRPKGESVESFARKLRYEFFECAAEKLGTQKTAVAHNKNDLAETAIFNLSRGTGIKGARGMAPVRENIIRPLIEISRREIESYCAENGIEFASDSTNKSDEYARNRIRLNVIPELEKINGCAVDNIARFCGQAQELNAYIEAVAQKTVRDSYSDGGYDIKCLLKNGGVVAKYSLKYIIEGLGATANETSLLLCIKLLDGSLKEVQLNEETYLRTEKGLLVPHGGQSEKPEAFCAELHEGLNSFNDGLLVNVTVLTDVDIYSFIKSSKNILNNSIDCDKIIGNVVLRNRREGDTFTSNARGNTKKVKKLFNEKNIDRDKRGFVPIISDDGGIIWIMGEGISRSVAVTEETKEIWHITTIREDA